MTRFNLCSALLITAGAAFAFNGVAQAALFTDNFNRPDNNDLTDVYTGQGGTLAPLSYGGTYSNASDRTIKNDQLWIDNAAIAVPDHDFNGSAITSAGGFVLTVDVNPVVGGGGTSQNWTAIVLGGGSSGAAPTGGSTPFAFFLNDEGGNFIFEQGGSVPDVQPAVVSGPGSHSIQIRVETSAFGNGDAATAYVSVDGEEVTHTVSGQPSNAFAFTWTGSSNYVTLTTYIHPSGSSFDNLSITAGSTVPEPASLALLALGGLALLPRRKRAVK